MKKALLIYLFLLHSSIIYALDDSVNKHNWQVAKHLVENASEFASKHGQLSLFSAINNAQLLVKNSYVFALNTNGYVLAHPYRKDLIGKNEALEKKYVRRMLDIINQYQEGWIEYHFIDPATGKNVAKLSYIKRISAAVFIGAGVY